MKKIALLTAVALVLCSMLCACGKSDEVSDTSEPASMPDYIEIVADDSDVEVNSEVSDNEHNVAGGWNTSKDGVITEAAQEAFDKATKPGGMTYTPVSLLGTQVVAGINYAFLCDGQPTDDESAPTRSYKIIVYADLEGNAEITSIEPYTAEQ